MTGQESARQLKARTVELKLREIMKKSISTFLLASIFATLLPSTAKADMNLGNPPYTVNNNTYDSAFVLDYIDINSNYYKYYFTKDPSYPGGYQDSLYGWIFRIVNGGYSRCVNESCEWQYSADGILSFQSNLNSLDTARLHSSSRDIYSDNTFTTKVYTGFAANYTPSTPTTPFLSFPLEGFTPYTTPVSSVFDHSGNARYDNNGQVVAFTGEKGTLGPYLGSTCYSKTDGSEFGSEFNYTGTSGSGGRLYLCYDGHPGTDYPVPANTPIYAPADGIAHLPLNFPGYLNAQNYNTIEIDHQNGYKTYYLHLNSQNITENQQVIKGATIIGYSGDTGSTGAYHLHFEVQKNGIPVDPYGWQGAESDPYQTVATNENLWIPPPISVGGNASFTSVQVAYDSATRNGQTFLLQEQVFSEDLVFAKNLTVTLRGGYDSNYQTNSGWTTIFGKLTIRSGTLVVDSICIQ